jgi:hypothetical protein
MTNALEIHIGENTEPLARRFIDAWHRAERGDTVEEHHLSFESRAGLASFLTKRNRLRRGSKPA